MQSVNIPTVSRHLMRAVVVSQFGGPEVLQIKQDVPIPTPAPDEVLIKVVAIGVNPVDTYIRTGTYSRRPPLPYTPGNDVCGTVVTTGADVEGFQPGDRVSSFFCCRSGGCAEYCAVHSDWLIPLPKDYDFTKGAALGVPFFSAYKSLIMKANAKPTDTVLIHGATGGVGLAACQIALSRGMTVYGTAGSKEGMNMLQSLGVEKVFNHQEENYMDKIMEATDHRGVDVILEMLANVNLNKDLQMIAQNGCVVVVGCRGSVEINPRLLMKQESKVCGMGLFNSSKQEFAEMVRALRAGIEHGWVNPCIGAEYSLNDVVQAHKDIITNSGCKGKMILRA